MKSDVGGMAPLIQEFESYLESWSRDFSLERATAIGRLISSMDYSLRGGGKRFRPVLALAVGQSYSVPSMKILPWAMAVEMIHTYSLIHDDLPCMDDDDERRGRPTNHKKFDEATALLAGDSLLTEAFLTVAQSYSGHGPLASRLTEELGLAAGARGMVGGQALDLAADLKPSVALSELERIHDLKTGRLIQVSLTGAAKICEADQQDLEALARYGILLGRCFQVADDLLDADQDRDSSKSYIAHFGIDGTKKELSRLSQEARSTLSKLSRPAGFLSSLVSWNEERSI